jgi:elongation factor Ts
MVTANDVKALREKTGAGMMDCKNALMESNGDTECAIKILREKGLASAAKKADRIAAEGVVGSFTCPKGGAVVEVNCETDFVARTPVFTEFVAAVAKHIFDKNPADVTALLVQDMDGSPVSEVVKAKTGEIGEKIDIRRFARFEVQGAGLVDSYIHMGGKIGVLLEAVCESAAAAGNDALRIFAHDISMQIAAAKPLYINPADVPQDVLNSEKEILRVQALNEGKPEKIIDKMVEGRIQKYYKDFCLLEQPFVKDQDKSVKQLTAEISSKLGEKITLKRFVRFEMGEGLEKRKDDFAEEVIKQASK